MRHHAARTLLIALGLALCVGARAQTVQEGEQYTRLEPPRPVASGSKVEVIEFFYYGCPGCNSLQPTLRAWLKTKPADVAFRSAPVVFRDDWIPLTKAYYAFEAMGVLDKTHYQLFSAIHDRRTLEIKNLFRDPSPLYDWVAKQGVDRQKFIDVYKSFGVGSRTNRSIELPGNYNVTSTPSLVVDGRYLTTPAMVGSYEGFFRVLDQLIAMARTERAARK